MNLWAGLNVIFVLSFLYCLFRLQKWAYEIDTRTYRRPSKRERRNAKVGLTYRSP